MFKQIIVLIILILAVIGGISLVNGESIGEFQLTEDVQIFQTCNNCTFCDFSRVMGLNDRTLFTNINAIKDENYFYYDIASPNFTNVGKYTYCYTCGNNVKNDTGCLDFTITYTGGDLTLQMVILYSISIGFLIFLFILVLLFTRTLPSKDAMDEEGIILQINQLKHLRPLMYAFAWVLVLTMLFIISNLTVSYLPTFMFGNLFFAFYKIMFWFTIIAVPLWFIWMFTNIFRDKEFKRMIERGVEMRGQP